jgi:CheY-like chemotaxis protein
MRRQVDHMVRLIDDLLDVARITGGRLELKKERVDLAQTVMTAIEMCRPFLEKRQQLVHTELQSPVFALADGARVGQIVANLLHNASKFSANGAELGVQLSFADGHAEIRVSDPGAGISADDLERVFEMFASGGKGGGLGIGLALSRKLADLHEGKLVAQSAGLAHGSTFTLVLPAEVTGATPPKTQPPQAVRGNGKRVLIIEDNHDAAEMLLLLLEQGDYSVTLAHSGSDGLRQAREQRPSILLCDIGLPDMTGLEVCRQIRSQDLGYRPTLIALTGWGMEHDIARSREAGFDHHLVKPVAPETLFDLLRELWISLCRSQLTGWHVSRDFAGGLVAAQTEQARVSQLAVTGPLHEGDLHHELGLHPVHALARKPGAFAEGWLLLLEGVELLS